MSLSSVKFIAPKGSKLSVKNLEKGSVLLDNLHLSDSYSFGNVFQGYMDYTYFYYSNEFLKKRKLKLGLVLNHTNMQFEIWLLGQTALIQDKYWEYFKKTKWNKDRDTKPTYSILETALIENPDFNDLKFLSQQVEDKLLVISKKVIEDIEKSELT